MQAYRRKPHGKWATPAGFGSGSRSRQDEPDGSEQSDAPCLQQGDAGSLYSHESLPLRYQLRQHPDVLEALHMWWSVAQSSAGGGSSDSEHLLRDDYVRPIRRIRLLALHVQCMCTAHAPLSRAITRAVAHMHTRPSPRC